MTGNNKKSNIVLVGFMGSGKTVIGRNVARILNYGFADTDEYIREVTGMDLAKLYRKYGEIRFRSEEKLAVSKLSAGTRQVIACGGSLLPARDSLDILFADGFVVQLSASPEVIMGRLGRKGDRLLPTGRPTLPDIEAMLEEREKFFAGLSHIRVDTGVMSVEEAADYIVAEYREYLRRD